MREKESVNSAAAMAGRLNLDEEAIKSLKICMIGAGGFIGSHLCEKLMFETDHSVLAIDVYGDKIQHLLQPGQEWSDRIEFHKINIKSDSRLEGLIKVSDLVCSPTNSFKFFVFEALGLLPLLPTSLQLSAVIHWDVISREAVALARETVILTSEVFVLRGRRDSGVKRRVCELLLPLH